LEQGRRPAGEFQIDFALSHPVATTLKHFSTRCGSMNAEKQEPVDFPAERLCLALLSVPTAESGMMRYRL
jgi:hypothetical protein